MGLEKVERKPQLRKRNNFMTGNMVGLMIPIDYLLHVEVWASIESAIPLLSHRNKRFSEILITQQSTNRN